MSAASPQSMREDRPHRRGVDPAALCLVALLLAAAALLIHETRGTTFANDEWTWIFDRRGGGLATWLAPHNVHLSLVPVAVYKILFATAGLRTYLPYRLFVIAAHLLCVALIFRYARPRVGAVGALAAALLILTLGPGWEEFLWPFNMTFLFAVDAGLAALILLERRTRRADAAACVLLGLSLASAGPGVAFAVGCAVEVLGRRRPRDLWIVVAPLLLYGAWWLHYHPSTGSVSPGSVPGFVIRAAAAAMGALCGLSGANALTGGGHWLRFGLPLLAVGVVALALRLWALRAVPWRIVVLLATALAFWVTVGLGRGALRLGNLVLAATGHEGRYVYIGAVLLVLIATEAAAPRTRTDTADRLRLRVPRGRAPAAAVVILALPAVLAATVSNLRSLRDGAAYQRSTDALARAGLGVIELARRDVPSGFAPAGFAFGVVTAGQYLAAEHALGRGPAAGPAEIASDAESIREATDAQFATVVGLHPRALEGRSCHRARTVHAGAPFTLPRGGAAVVPIAGSVQVAARRFATSYGSIGLVPAGGATLTARADSAPRPWQLRFTRAVRVCAPLHGPG